MKGKESPLCTPIAALAVLLAACASTPPAPTPAVKAELAPTGTLPYYRPAMFGMGIGELLVVLVIVLVVFGAGRLPEVMGSLGKGVQAFKKGVREPPEIDVTPEKPEPDAKAKP